MTVSKLLDSSIWLAYLFNGLCADIVESGELFFLSTLSLFELRKKLASNGFPAAKISKSMDFVKAKSLTIPLSANIAEEAVTLAIYHDLPAIDSLIYATAILNSVSLITLDNDFRGLKHVVIPHTPNKNK